ncbi:hypothetical protein ACVILE_006924 [Streptomyces sp. M18.1]
MVPRRRAVRHRYLAAPRTRGDGPDRPGDPNLRQRCSPHPRGWSLLAQLRADRRSLLPAPAGMVRRPTPERTPPRSAPRTRGDGPAPVAGRGVSHSCSPHPRGWSRRCGRTAEQRPLLPAPAGMVPRSCPCGARTPTAPRTRGDGPAAPGPRSLARCCSPHPRGWSLGVVPGLLLFRLLPAPAGMVPAPRPTPWEARAAPRTRGDGPVTADSVTEERSCSPHPRGWSLCGNLDQAMQLLLPAPSEVARGLGRSAGRSPATRRPGRPGASESCPVVQAHADSVSSRPHICGGSSKAGAGEHTPGQSPPHPRELLRADRLTPDGEAVVPPPPPQPRGSSVSPGSYGDREVVPVPGGRVPGAPDQTDAGLVVPALRW